MEILGAFLIGLASGLVGAISTGGGLISIPGVIFLGLTPLQAIATTRLSAVSGGTASLLKYNKGKVIVWKYMLYFMLISFMAGIIGPKLLLQINEEYLEKIIGFLLIAMLPLLLLSKDFGAVEKHKGKKHKIWGFILLFLIMIYATMFGAGGGIFLIYTLIYFFGLTVTQANATGTAMWMIGTLVALVAYLSQGAVSLAIGVPLLIGAAVGGNLGARIALKKGTVWVKSILVVVIVTSSIKLLFF